MVSNRLLFPIIIPFFILLHRSHSQCSCSKNNILKNLQGSRLQFAKNSLPSFEKFSELLNNGRKNAPEVNSVPSTMQQPAIDLHNRNIVQQPLEFQIPISSTSISIGNGIFSQGQPTKQTPRSNCCQSPGKDSIGELNFINRPNSGSCLTQNSQKRENGFIPVSISVPSNVMDLSNQLGSGPYFVPSSVLSNLFPQNYIQNLPSNLEKTVTAQSPIFNPVTQNAQTPPLVYVIQAPSMPQYVPPVAYPTAAHSSKSMDLQSLIPLILNLLKKKNCGCNCPNCLNCCCDRFKMEHPIIHSGYANKIVNGQINNKSKPLETPEEMEDKSEDLKVEAEKNSAKDEDIDSGEYYDAEDPEFKDESKEN